MVKAQLEYLARTVRRLPPRLALRLAMPRWQNSSSATHEGYTFVVGVKHEVVPILHATVGFLDASVMGNLHEIIVVFDRTETPELAAEVDRLRAENPDLPVRAFYYSPRQQWLAQRLQLPWFYCCMNWCIGIDETETDTILLHDLDAMMLRPEVYDERYERMRRDGLHWFGDSARVGRGAIEEDGFAATWEMFFDRAHVVDNHAPVDLFNRMGRIGDRIVDFDITIWAQHLGGKRAIEEIGEAAFVHPSQVIHQYTEMQRTGVLEPLSGMMILFALYFMHLGGRSGPMLSFTEDSAGAPVDRLPFDGYAIDCSAMSAPFVASLRQRVTMLEEHVAGAVRGEVEAYLAAVEEVLGRSAATR